MVSLVIFICVRIHFYLKDNITYKNENALHTSGESTRKGFYVYDKNRKAGPNPELKKYIEKARSISGVSVDPKVSLPIFPHKHTFALLHSLHLKFIL